MPKHVMDPPNFCFMKMDICDRETVNALFGEEPLDIVVNFAAESYVDRSIGSLTSSCDEHLGPAALMDACHRYSIMHYHPVSTNLSMGTCCSTVLNDFFFHTTTELFFDQPFDYFHV